MTIRAVLFDVDGTLYHQGRLRIAMAAELGVATLRANRTERRRLLRTLRTFRHVREELRERYDGPLETLQYSVTAQRVGIPEDAVRATVAEWILHRPLKHLRLARRAGLREAVEHLRGRGLEVGAFSDYPTRDKIRALGLSELFSLHVCATDAAVNAFKPHPAGFLRACAEWGLAPAAVLYVGDRLDVDAVGARAAGLPSLILRAPYVPAPASVPTLTTFRRLLGAIERIQGPGSDLPGTVPAGGRS